MSARFRRYEVYVGRPLWYNYNGGVEALIYRAPGKIKRPPTLSRRLLNEINLFWFLKLECFRFCPKLDRFRFLKSGCFEIEAFSLF